MAIQLHVLNGASAGKKLTPDKFPVTVGREPGNSLLLTELGVFDKHFEICFSSEGFVLVSREHAVVTVNGQPPTERILRNGDVIGAGLAKIQFWLGALPQRGLKTREVGTWLLILFVALVEAYCLWRLLAMARS